MACLLWPTPTRQTKIAEVLFLSYLNLFVPGVGIFSSLDSQVKIFLLAFSALFDQKLHPPLSYLKIIFIGPLWVDKLGTEAEALDNQHYPFGSNKLDIHSKVNFSPYRGFGTK